MTKLSASPGSSVSIMKRRGKRRCGGRLVNGHVVCLAPMRGGGFRPGEMSSTKLPNAVWRFFLSGIRNPLSDYDPYCLKVICT